MTNPSPVVMEEVNALLDERSRYERWLAQLNARKDQTPSHVYERVRGDYAGRLATVMEQLRGRADGLQGTTSSLEARVAELQSQESQKRDARAEIELRAMVGEYPADRADTELAAIDAELGRLESERTAAMSELGRLQDILALVRQPEAKAAATPSTSRPLGAPPAPERDAAIEELAFLNSVVDKTEPAPPATRQAEAVPMVTSLGPSGLTGPQQTIREAPRPSAGTPAATPAFLKDMPTEQVKTLKCQECGTMNYPTEWYCERCGGELAAM
jgi:hypothetical protein